MGYPASKIDQSGAGDEAQSSNLEWVERMAFDDEYSNWDNPVLDESQRETWVVEAYIRVDKDGDGIAELRKVTRAGGVTLDDEVTDEAPFVSICPIPEPHKFYGLSISDLAQEGQKTETALLRATLDNLYLEVNGRYFAVEGQVNLDDLLSSRPGGIVRTKSPQAVGRLDQGKGNIGETMSMLEYMKAYNEDATGWSRMSMGNDPSSLNRPETATKANIVANKADMRVDLIARNFAEGFVELFRVMLKLVCQHQDKGTSIKLSGGWVDMDPREWRNQFDININVGLGTGNKDQNVAHLMGLMQAQGNALQIGVANPENVYNAAVELAKNMGFKNGEKFFTKPDPTKPLPNPMQGQMQIEQMKAQSSAQVAQMQAQFKAQSEAADRQHQAQLEQLKAQYQAQVDNNRQASEAQQHAMKVENDARLAALEAHYKDIQHQRDTDLDERIALIKARAQIISSRISAKEDESDIELSAEGDLMGQGQSKADILIQGQQQMGQHLSNLANSIAGLAQAHARPKQIVRDQSGRAVGIQ
jgi:hypothetical protein